MGQRRVLAEGKHWLPLPSAQGGGPSPPQRYVPGFEGVKMTFGEFLYHLNSIMSQSIVEGTGEVL